MIEIKLVGMSMTFDYNKLNLSVCSGSCVVFTRQNINFNFLMPSTFVFLVFHKNGHNKSSSSFEDISAYKSYGITLTGSSFASTSLV
jgi:hypothetical protein